MKFKELSYANERDPKLKRWFIRSIESLSGRDRFTRLYEIWRNDIVGKTDRFKAEHGVQTTPQTFIDGVRIGGHDDLRRERHSTVIQNGYHQVARDAEFDLQ